MDLKQLCHASWVICNKLESHWHNFKVSLCKCNNELLSFRCNMLLWVRTDFSSSDTFATVVKTISLFHQTVQNMFTKVWCKIFNEFLTIAAVSFLLLLIHCCAIEISEHNSTILLDSSLSICHPLGRGDKLLK